jgi:peptide/nickel transport system substrate-binding protein
MLSRRAVLASAGALALPSVARAQNARVLKFVPQAAYSVPDPIWTTAIIVATHAFMVWDTLYGVDLKLAPHPQMCAGHEVSSDGLTWTFTLRPGLLWHDGEKVRAIDATTSIRRWAERDSFGQRIAALTAEMKPLDDTRFQIRLTRPFPLMLYALGAQNCFIMPERMAKQPAKEPIKEFVGSGPFRFRADQWVSGVRAVYERFDKYLPRQEAPEYTAGGKVVHFDRVEWSVQPDPGTAASALQAGEVDWIDQPLFDLVPLLKKSDGVRVQALDPFGLTGIILMNHLHPPFNNAKIRHAVLAAVDQHEFVAAVLGDQTEYATLPVGYFTAGTPLANDAGMQALTGKRDLAAARKAVQEAGYNGAKVLLMDPTDQVQQHAMAQVTASLFTKLGLNVEVMAMDWGSLLSRRASTKPPAEGGWNCLNTRLSGLDMSNPASIGLRGNGLKGWFGWPDAPQFVSLREQWFDAPDLAAQQKIARQEQLAAFEVVPYVPLGQWAQPTAFRSDLTGFLRSPNPLFWNVRRG